MSSYSQFDAKGPHWEGSSAAIEEENQLQKLLEESKKRNMEPNIDSSTSAELERELNVLHVEEKALLHQLGQCDNEQEGTRIENNILLVRQSFSECKKRYFKLRQSQT